MFGFFKKKSELERLQDDYAKLQREAYQLSTSNRIASDKKQAEAAAVLEKIDMIRAQEN